MAVSRETQAILSIFFRNCDYHSLRIAIKRFLSTKTFCFSKIVINKSDSRFAVVGFC